MEKITQLGLAALNSPLFHQFLGFWGLLFLVIAFIHVARGKTVYLTKMVYPCAWLSVAAILCYNFLIKGLL